MVTPADAQGWTRFAGLQLEYSLAQRSIEAEYFPLLESISRPHLQEPYALLNQPNQQARMFGEYRQRIEAHHHTIPG